MGSQRMAARGVGADSPECGASLRGLRGLCGRRHTGVGSHQNSAVWSSGLHVGTQLPGSPRSQREEGGGPHSVIPPVPSWYSRRLHDRPQAPCYPDTRARDGGLRPEQGWRELSGADHGRGDPDSI